MNTANCAWLTTSFGYDIAGNLLSETDANGHSTSFSYNDNYSDGVNRESYGFVTAVTNALGQSTHSQIDYHSGQPSTTTDLNGVVTAYSYNDPLDRLTQSVQAVGLSGFQNQTNYTYPSATESDVYQDQNVLGDEVLHNRRYLDGFGRPIETDQFENATQYIAATQSYDALGRISATTNPSRPGDGLNYSTTYHYDGLGRQLSIIKPDGSGIAFAYSGDLHMESDEAGVTRWHIVDGLGRTSQVIENPGGLGYTTYYTVAANDTLQKVTQGSETRTFRYDSLGRLTSSTQPEMGTISYSYDNVGNLSTRTDARGIVECYGNLSGGTCDGKGYDALNRPTQIDYSDQTQWRTFGYDAAGAGYSWGHLTSVSNGTATINCVSISPLGQVTASTEITGGGTYNFSYYYNLAGALTQENYPSGRVITTLYDYANRPNFVAGTRNGTQTNYVSNLTYFPHGAPSSYTYGNSIWPVSTYNSRLQENQTWAAVNNNPNNFIYYFAFNYGTTNNNGSVLAASELIGNSVPWNSLTSYSQTYTYDALNRLSGATDMTGSTTNWSRTFAYDQYGNAWVPSVTGIGWGVSTPAWNVYNTKNQVGDNQPYDAAGNITTLPPNYSFTYDAENRVTYVDTSGNLSASYYYDGLGERVEKVAGSQSTVYVYDAFGRLAEEYSPATTWSKDYIPFNGQTAVIENATASPCTTCYLSYDYLGTPRLVTDQNASVMARHDYLPFGDEIPAGTAGRGSQFGPYMDNVDQKFTGQVRDTETLNDFFNARYFTAPLMRFLSADPGNAGADPTDPQTWNAYAYVRNNPLAFTDPSGMLLIPSDPWDGVGGDPCGVDSFDPSSDDPFPPCGVSIPIIPPISVGRNPGRPPSSAPTSTGGLTPIDAPFPPGSFPGGENLGLPPGMSVPGPWNLMPNPWVLSVSPAALPGFVCATDPVCLGAAVAAGALLGGWVLTEEMNKGVFQPTGSWQYTGPKFIIQKPTITLMAKGGKQNVAHDYTKDLAAEMFPGDDLCTALRKLAGWARRTGNSKLFNDTKATWKQNCRTN